MKVIMKEDINRWVNSLTKLELALYNINKDEINRWLNEFENQRLPKAIRHIAYVHLNTTLNKGTHNED